MNRISLAIATVAVATLGTAVAAQAQENPVKITAPTAVAKVAPGGKVTVKLNAEIDGGWHIYSLTQAAGGPTPTMIKIPTPKDQPPPFVSIDGTATGSEFDSKFDQNFSMQVEFYENHAEFSVPLLVEKTAPTGKQSATVLVRYQACNASQCLPPKSDKIQVALDIGTPKAAAKAKKGGK